MVSKSDVQGLAGRVSSAQLPTESKSARPGLQYFMTIAVDLCKLVHHVKQESSEDLKPYFDAVTPNIKDFCLSFFNCMVVHESGKTATDSIAFIRNCLYELMTDQEKEEFVCTIVQDLLTVPTKAFSQNAVLDALNLIGVPVKLYISYMVEKLKPYVKGEAIPAGNSNPITMMVSVLAMSLSSYTQLKEVDAVDHVPSDEPMNHDH